jgi:hypothetical protein
MVWAIRSRRSIPISHLSSVGSAPWWRLRKSLKGISESDHARTRIKGSIGFEARGPTLLLLREMAPRCVGVARAPDIRSRSSDLAVSRASYRSHPDVRCIPGTDLMEPPSETEFSNPRQDGIVGVPQTLCTRRDVLRCGRPNARNSSMSLWQSKPIPRFHEHRPNASTSSGRRMAARLVCIQRDNVFLKVATNLSEVRKRSVSRRDSESPRPKAASKPR